MSDALPWRNNNIVHYCIKSSVDWHKFLQLSLVTNMRAHGEAEVEFNNFLLSVGSNTRPTKPDDPFCSCIKLAQSLMEQCEQDGAGCAYFPAVLYKTKQLNKEQLFQLGLLP